MCGVRPEILLSWYRCREVYNVDPHLARAPSASADHGERSLEHDMVLTELGGLAVAATRELDALDGLATVTDGSGRILASWGDRRTLLRAAGSNLAPWSAWSERASGTNGMGSALAGRGPTLVRGVEHWCEGFHDWACAGIAIHDAVTDQPLAALNISSWQTPLPNRVATWLRRAAKGTEDELRRRACHGGAEIAAAFAKAASRDHHTLAAFDSGGKIVVAGEQAARLLGVPAGVPAVDPGNRWHSQLHEVTRLARLTAERAREDPHWVGSAQISAPAPGEAVSVVLHPIVRRGQVLGTLLIAGAADGEYVPAADLPPNARQGPVIGVRETRLVLLRPIEIRYAEAERNRVWLSSDRGRIRAAAPTLDTLEEQLANQGFLRVHRGFLVNLNRVREVEQGFRGTLWLVTDARGHETVPVARRHVPELRRVLGL